MKNAKSVSRFSIFKIVGHIFQGALIGLGAVLPGISGGVLSVLFGVYKPLMEFLANPVKCLKTHLPFLLPYLIGYVLGFMGVANLLSFFLTRYPAPSICLFVGLIAGMLPSLWEEAGLHGRNHFSYLSLGLSMLAVLFLLLFLRRASILIIPGFGWYLFCGFCLALSIIAPGMSFSALLMPLGLYTPFIDGIGRLSPHVLIPGGIGALITIVFLSRTVNNLFQEHYSVTFHGITGVILSATALTIPFDSFTCSVRSCLLNIFCLSAGIFVSQLVERSTSENQYAAPSAAPGASAPDRSCLHKHSPQAYASALPRKMR